MLKGFGCPLIDPNGALVASFKAAKSIYGRVVYLTDIKKAERVFRFPWFKLTRIHNLTVKICDSLVHKLFRHLKCWTGQLIDSWGWSELRGLRVGERVLVWYKLRILSDQHCLLEVLNACSFKLIYIIGAWPKTINLVWILGNFLYFCSFKGF